MSGPLLMNLSLSWCNRPVRLRPSQQVSGLRSRLQVQEELSVAAPPRLFSSAHTPVSHRKMIHWPPPLPLTTLCACLFEFVNAIGHSTLPLCKGAVGSWLQRTFGAGNDHMRSEPKPCVYVRRLGPDMVNGCCCIAISGVWRDRGGSDGEHGTPIAPTPCSSPHLFLGVRHCLCAVVLCIWFSPPPPPAPLAPAASAAPSTPLAPQLTHKLT